MYELIDSWLISYFGHLSLDPAGLQGRDSFLCCCWTVKVHKAIPCETDTYILNFWCDVI